MQTTLLGFALTIIVALLAALVGPLLVDWTQYRSSFEAEASRVLGAPVRIDGAIDARLLPAPSLTLQRLTIGDPKDPRAVKAQAMEVEFSLGALMRGQLRADEAQLVGPEVTLGLDRSGTLDLPPVAVDFNPDRVSIESLTIENGRAHLVDAVNGNRITLDKLRFKGSLQSLAGPVKGEGAFVTADESYGYRLSASRREEDGALQLHLSFDPADRPVTVDTTGALSLGSGGPHFEGRLKVTRRAEPNEERGRGGLDLPWRVSSKIRIGRNNAKLQQIEMHYGRDDTGVRFTGTADLRFGKQPLLKAVLSATQLDVDRLIATRETPIRRPVDALETAIARFGKAVSLPVPAQLSISVDSVTIGGQSVLTLGGDLHSVVGGGWEIDNLEFRAPGLTQVALSGSIDMAPELGFKGPVSLETNDPAALAAWLERRDAIGVRLKPFRGRGDMVLNRQEIAVEHLDAAVDGKALTGSLSYRWAAGKQPSRLAATLSAPDLDLDSMLALAGAVRRGTGWQMPQEVALNLTADHASIAGVDAKSVRAQLTQSSNLIDVKQLSVADVGGASFDAHGRIDLTGVSPRGSLVLDLQARSLDGVMAIAGKFAPDAVHPFRDAAAGVGESRLHAMLTVDGPSQPTSGTDTVARLQVNGQAGDLRASVRSEISQDSAAVAANGMNSLASGKLAFNGELASDDGPALAALFELDNVLAVGKGPGQVKLAANGRLGRSLHVDGRVVAAGLDARARGTAHLIGVAHASAQLQFDVTKADIAPLRDYAQKRAEPLPLALRGNLAVGRAEAKLDKVAGSIGGAALRGKLDLGFGPKTTISGQIAADQLDAAAVIAAAIGLRSNASPARSDSAGDSSGNSPDWSSEPFAPGLGGGLNGAVDLTVSRATVTPTIAAQQVKTKVVFAGPQISLEQLDAHLAGGHLSGRLSVGRDGREVSTRAQFRLASVDASALVPGDSKPIHGHLSAQFDLQAAGLSPKALVGSLAGTGTLTLQDGDLLGLDPRAFEKAIIGSDQGATADTQRLRTIVAAALDSGPLPVPRFDATVVVSAGQARFAETVAKSGGIDLTAAGSVDLVRQRIDARLTLTGPAGGEESIGRPDIIVNLKGPTARPQRSIDVSALASWLTIRAIDRQAKKLQALEAEHRAAAQNAATAKPDSKAMTGSTRPAAPSPAPAVTSTIAVPRTTEEREPLPQPTPGLASDARIEAPANGGAESGEPTPPTARPREQTATAEDRPRSRERQNITAGQHEPLPPAAKYERQLAPALPDPVEIRPVPRGPRGGSQANSEAAARDRIHAPLVLPSVTSPAGP